MLFQGRAIAVQHTAFGPYIDHVVILWGAEYDKSGNIQAIYISDSDDQYQESSVGMKRYLVKNVQGKARNTSSINPEIRGVEISYIYTLDLGQQKWEEYFSK